MWQVGVLDDVLTNVDNVVRKGRLGPGQTVVADLSSGTFKENTQIAKEVGRQAPYAGVAQQQHPPEGPGRQRLHHGVPHAAF